MSVRCTRLLHRHGDSYCLRDGTRGGRHGDDVRSSGSARCDDIGTSDSAPVPATRHYAATMNNSPKLNIDRQVRLRFGMTKRNKLARAAPIPADHGIPLVIRLDEVQAFEELAVVAIVRVPVLAELPAIVRGLLELKLKVGGAEECRIHRVIQTGKGDHAEERC